MDESTKRRFKTEEAQPDKEPQKEAKKEIPKILPLWNFPLQGRTVRAKNLIEAKKIINANK